MKYYIADFSILPQVSDLSYEYIKSFIDARVISINRFYAFIKEKPCKTKWIPLAKDKYIIETDFFIHELTAGLNDMATHYCFCEISEDIIELARKEISFTVYELLTLAQRGTIDNFFSRDGDTVISVNDLCKLKKDEVEQNG